MSYISTSAAIREALHIEMENDPNVYILGEDVGFKGGDWGEDKGLFAKFGGKRTCDTGISETAIIGHAVGSAAVGLRPIVEIMHMDFQGVCMDEIMNQAAKMRYMFGGKISLPMVVRLPAGAGSGAAAQHSQSLEAWVTHIPGLKVVYPSCAEDALGLMLTAIDDDNPVIFFEGKLLYGMKTEVNSFEPIPLGKGKICREGGDVSIITYGRQVFDALKAADKLAADGIEAEVIDLRSLYPLDKELIEQSLSKTHKAIVLTEEVKRGGYGGEISAIIAEEMFDYLDAPVARIGALNTPVPFTPVLEQYYMPNEEDVIVAAKKMF